jgi:hypothetical protein
MKMIMAILLFVSSICTADEVLLKTGYKILNTRLIDSTSEYVTVSTKGRDRRIPTSSVIKVIRKKYDLSFDSITDTIISTKEYPPPIETDSSIDHPHLLKEMGIDTPSAIDRIVFRDGKSIKGKITLIKTDAVAIEDAETGILFEYKKLQIAYIHTANGKILSLNQIDGYSSTSRSNIYSMITAGIVIPVSDYALRDIANSKSGFAKTGYGVGVDIIADILPNIQLQFGGLFYSNAVDGGFYSHAEVDIGNYYSGNILGGFRFITSESEDHPRLHIGARIGLFLGSYPKIDFSGASTTSSIASAFAYNANAGIILGDKIDFSIQYFASSPKYQISSGVSSAIWEYEQPTSFIMISFGITIGDK